MDDREENHQLYLEICERLLVAGYFRVQIATLTPFDKVVGGLVWCLTWVGTDMLAALGDAEILKFREYESIGYKISISEKVAASLIKMGYSLEPHQIQGLDYPALILIVKSLLTKVQDSRLVYRDFNAQHARYRFHKYLMRSHHLDEDAELSQKNDSFHSLIDFKRLQAHISNLQHQQQGTQEARTVMQNDLIAIRKQLAESNALLKDRTNQLAELKQLLAQKTSQCFNTDGKTLDEIIPADIRRDLQLLIDERDQLRQRKLEFQLQCKANLKDIKRQIAKLTSIDTSTSDIKPVAEKEKESVETLQRKLAQLKAQIYKERFNLEKYPDGGTLELKQYQKRFTELYHQVSTKLLEHRQHFTTYNALENIQMQQTRELSLLKSVYENILKTAKSKPNQDKLMQSLREWTKAARENCDKIAAKCGKARKFRDNLEEEYQNLSDLQVKYYRTISDFQLQCRLNQKLQSPAPPTESK